MHGFMPCSKNIILNKRKKNKMSIRSHGKVKSNNYMEIFGKNEQEYHQHLFENNNLHMIESSIFVIDTIFVTGR